MGQPIRVTVLHSDLRSDELLSYMQGMDCNKLGKTQFLMNTLYLDGVQIIVDQDQPRPGLDHSKSVTHATYQIWKKD